MIGERNHRYPTVDVPPWSYTDDRGANRHFMISPSGIVNSSTNFTNYADDYSLFLHHETCPNDVVYDSELEIGEEVFGSVGDFELPVDVYACDSFRMYEFKVRKCARGRSHDWTDCPYAHPGEKARRRDPRKYQYSGTACPDYRKGNCSRGDICEFAHGVFECWLHPTRYRTQPCKDGGNCKRKVCFFAHSPEQLRVISPNSDSHVRALHFLSSPESSSPPTESPPMSPMTANSFNSLSRSLGSSSVNEMMASLRQLQLNRLNSMPSPRNLQVGSSGLGSPRRPVTRPGYSSLPVTPTGYLTQHGSRCFDIWEEEPAMERVESGRDLRVKMFQRLSKENPLDGVDPNPSPVVPNPDVGWVSDLIQ